MMVEAQLESNRYSVQSHSADEPLLRRRTTPQTPWIAYHRPLPDARLRLFCFHHAGGGASVFRPWAELLQPYQIELCPVQLPGRENRINEAPHTNLRCLVKELQKALAPWMDLPFALLGHSMGGIVAFHLAQILQRRNWPLRRLIIAAATPPLARCRAPIHQLPDSSFIQRVEEYNGLPADLLQNHEFMALLLPTLRADFALCERADTVEMGRGKSYMPPVLHCPLSIFTGLSDQSIDAAEVEQWRHYSIEAVKIRKFPGDHFFLYRQQSLVIRTIVQDLFSVTA